MAENNPLDPLGPDFGGINRPTPGEEQDFLPFEGESLALPEPNLGPIFTPKVTSNQDQIKRDVIGTSPTSKPNVSAQDFAKSALGMFNAKASTMTDKNVYGGIYSYDASPSGGAFYDKYATFDPETFRKLGFNPLRDNEALYNQETSWFDRTSHMLKNSFVPLVGLGFKSGPKSLMRMMNGDFGADIEEAREYEYLSALGQDTSGGLGAFFNNTLMNFGYTAGIITEAIAEEVAAAVIAPFTGGASSALATANIGRRLARIKSLSLAKDLTEGVTKRIAATKNVNQARELYKASRLDNLEEITSSKIGKFLNPLENVTEAGIKMARNKDNLTGLARYSPGFGAFYRDVRNVNMALAEARLEGGFVENKVYENLYNDYYYEKGVSPDIETSKDMRKQAIEAGLHAKNWNTGLIYASNKILLPNLLGPKGGIRNYVRNKTKEVLETGLKEGKLVGKSKVLKSGKEVKSATVEYEAKGFMNNLKSLRRQPVGKTLAGIGAYFKANVSEGLQENAQEMIAQASEKYYVDSFKDPSLANHLYMRAAYNESLADQFTAQGFETFASGFFMGMFAGPLNQVMPAASIGYSKLFDKENYKNYIETRNKQGKGLASIITQINSDVDTMFNSRFLNYAAQSQAAMTMNSEEATNTQMEDAQIDAFASNMMTAIEFGTLDHTKEYLNSLQQLTAEEFEEALELEKGTGAEKQAKIGEVLQKIESIEAASKKYDKMFPMPVDLKDFEEGTAEYKNAQILNIAWKDAKRKLIFFNHSFNETAIKMRDLEQIIINNDGFKDLNQTDLQVLFESTRLDNEIALLEDEVSALTDSDTKDIKLIQEKESKLNKLKKFRDVYKTLFPTSEIDPGYKTRSESIQNKVVDIIAQRGLDVTQIKEEDLPELVQEATSQVDVEQVAALKEAYKEYIQSLGTAANATLFTDNIDTTFDQLMDYYGARKDNGEMAKLVNVLMTPENFYDLVKRNQEWVTRLYENRKEYYEQMVEQAMQATENNALLNALADQDIYLSAEDLEAWVNDQVIPTEFISHNNKEVIKPGHPKYDSIFMLFNFIVTARKGDLTTEKFEKELQDEIDELNRQEKAEIDALEKMPTREDIGEIIPPKGKKLTLKVITDNMDAGDYVEVTFKRTPKSDSETSVYYKDTEGNLRLNNEQGEIIDPKIKQKFESAKRYKIEMLPDPAQVKQIKDKYAKLRAEAIERYTTKKAEQPSERLVKFSPIAYDTPWDELPIEVAQAISNEFFNTYLEENPQEKEAFEQMTAEQQQDMIENFAKTHRLAKEIIDEYNTNKKIELLKSIESKVVIPKLKDEKGNELDLSKLSVSELKTQLRRLNAGIRELQSREELTPVNQERLQQAILIRQQLEDYIAYRAGIETFPKMQEAIAKLARLTALQSRIIRDDKTHTYYLLDENGNRLPTQFTSVTNKINELSSISEYVYLQQDKVDNAYKATLGNEKNKGTIDDFIELFKSSKPIGFELEGSFEDLRSRLTNNSTLEDVTEAVKSTAYEESRIVGTYIDAQARLFLSNRTPQFDENKITKEAFEQLFGENGYFTKIKEKIDSGELFVLAEDLRLYDEKLGIAGEIDLLLTDTEGRIFLVDMKTGSKNQWDSILEPNSFYTEKNKKFSAQTRAYENLLYNLTGIEVTSSHILPIEVVLDKKKGKAISATAPSNKNYSDVEMGRMLSSPFGRNNTVTQEVDQLIPRRSKEEIAKLLGAATAETLDPQVRRRLNSFDLTDTMINMMTEEQLAKAKEFKSKAEARPMVNMFLDMIFEDAGANEGGTGPMDEAERQKLEELLLQRMIAEEKAKAKNVDIINKKIEILRERKNKIAADAQTIRDTLGFLNDLLDSTVEGTLNDIEGIIAKVDNLEKVAQLILNTGQRKRASKILDSKANLKDQIRREFSVAQDVLNRIKELRADLQQLEEIEKDMNSQLSYYQNLVRSGEMKTLERKEIENKIKKVQKKLNTIQRLIERIRKAIRQSLGYINEYTKIWNTQFKALEKFKKDTGFRYLSQEEIQELIESTNPQDIKTLNEYAGLKSQYEELEASALQTIDDVELLEEVKEQENTRLLRLNNAAIKYQNQLRYLQELLEPTFEDLKSEPLVDVNPEAPAPENTNPSSPGAKEAKEQIIEKRIEDLLTQRDIDELETAGGLSLGTISLGGRPSAQPGSGAVYADLRTDINSIKNQDDYNKVSADLMFALSDQLIGILEFEELNQMLRDVENSLLNKNPEVFEVNDNTIANKTRFITKQSVSLAGIIKPGDEVIVDRFSKARDVVFVRRVSDGEISSVPRDQFNKFFIPKSNIKNMKDDSKTLDAESKQNKQESVNNAESFMSDFANLDAIRKDVDSKSPEELESYANELRNNLKNIMNC